MTKSELLFEEIAKNLEEDPEVSRGPMMSAPGLKYKSKVFCFYHENSMTFKLGRDFHLKNLAITSFEYLSPFKTKAPLYDWLIISEEFSYNWKTLAEKALERIKGN